jgi:hypothetical protein
LRRYETTFIVNPQADGGEILRENRIGTRRMQFPITGLTQGFYTSLIFDSEAGVLPKLDRYYKLEEPYIRYLTIRYDGPITEDVSLPFESPYEQGDSDSYGDRSHRSSGYRGERRHGRGPDYGRPSPTRPADQSDTAAPSGNSTDNHDAGAQ